MLRIAVVVASALLVSQAHADYRRFCAPQGQCFVCPRGQPACEMSYALSRAMTPPSMDRIVPPLPVPSSSSIPSQERQAAPLPPEARQPASQQQWKQAIVDEAQRYCDAYPKDPICHFQDQPAQ